MRHLHVSSGDPVTASLRASGLPGEFLSWSDVLHEGPVPGGLSLDQLSTVRAPFISARYRGASTDTVLRNLVARNAWLRASVGFDAVTLWFGHDLADQLRLIQLLAWFDAHGTTNAGLTLVCIDDHPDVGKFVGLRQLSPAQLAATHWTRRRVTAGELTLARRAWAAFTAESPAALIALARENCRPLPFLPAAFVRHMQQFPGVRDGLARTEREILDHVALRGGTVRDAFDVTQCDYEEVPFIGGVTFLNYVEQLAAGARPLLELGSGFRDNRWAHRLRITRRGRDLLAGRQDRYSASGIDRWLGGVHLEGAQPAWCWDDSKQTLVPAARKTARARSAGPSRTVPIRPSDR